jgi:hypothetical protein
MIFAATTSWTRRAACLGAALACTATLASAARAAEEEPGPRRIACTFQSGTSVSYEAGAFTSKPASPLSFSLDKIDLEGQSAQLIAGPDATPMTVRIVRAINANHFLEVVNEGFLNLTTIYDKDPKSGAYPAVHSRHLGLLGQPVFGQYTGLCKDQ